MSAPLTDSALRSRVEAVALAHGCPVRAVIVARGGGLAGVFAWRAEGTRVTALRRWREDFAMVLRVREVAVEHVGHRWVAVRWRDNA